MNRDEIRNTLEKLIVMVDEQRAETGVEIKEDASLRDGIGLDSLQITELIFEIEERFGMTIDDEEAKELRVAGDLITLIETKLKSA